MSFLRRINHKIGSVPQERFNFIVSSAVLAVLAFWLIISGVSAYEKGPEDTRETYAWEIKSNNR
ncbi:hypothetical protein D3C81_1255200 [compost metagenome]